MTRKDRCSYRWKRLERKSTRRRRGGTTGSGLAAERGIGVQRVEAVPVPAQARDGSHRYAWNMAITVRGTGWAKQNNKRPKGYKNDRISPN